MADSETAGADEEFFRLWRTAKKIGWLDGDRSAITGRITKDQSVPISMVGGPAIEPLAGEPPICGYCGAPMFPYIQLRTDDLYDLDKRWPVNQIIQVYYCLTGKDSGAYPEEYPCRFHDWDDENDPPKARAVRVTDLSAGWRISPTLEALYEQFITALIAENTSSWQEFSPSRFLELTFSEYYPEGPCRYPNYLGEKVIYYTKYYKEIEPFLDADFSDRLDPKKMQYILSYDRLELINVKGVLYEIPDDCADVPSQCGDWHQSKTGTISGLPDWIQEPAHPRCDDGRMLDFVLSIDHVMSKDMPNMFDAGEFIFVHPDHPDRFTSLLQGT